MGKSFTQITFDFGPPSGKELVEEEVRGDEKVEALVQVEEVLPLPVEAMVLPLQPAAQSVVEKERKKSTRGRRSLKEIALSADLVQVPEDEVLFSKQYYSIGEVAAMFREKQSLIRYWETEFDILKPRKNKKGDRFFRPVDVKNLVMIYDLLRRRKFTIEGAKEYLRKEKKAEEKFEMIQSLRKIKEFFLELKSSLTN